MDSMRDITVDELLEFCDYYEKHPLEAEKFEEEIEEATKFVDKYLLGNGDDEEPIKPDENTL